MEFVVELDRGTALEPWGLDLGQREGSEELLVRAVIPDSTASSSGQIRVGDAVIRVDGAAVPAQREAWDFTAAVRLFMTDRTELRLTVICRRPENQLAASTHVSRFGARRAAQQPQVSPMVVQPEAEPRPSRWSALTQRVRSFSLVPSPVARKKRDQRFFSVAPRLVAVRGGAAFETLCLRDGEELVPIGSAIVAAQRAYYYQYSRQSTTAAAGAAPGGGPAPTLRLLALNVGDAATPGALVDALGGGVCEIGWKAAKGAHTPTLDHLIGIGGAIGAWLKSDPANVAVLLDSGGGHARVGLSCAAACRVGARLEPSLLEGGGEGEGEGEGEGDDDGGDGGDGGDGDAMHDGGRRRRWSGPGSCDSAAEAYALWLRAAGLESRLSLSLLPPSFARCLSTLDAALMSGGRAPNASSTLGLVCARLVFDAETVLDNRLFAPDGASSLELDVGDEKCPAVLTYCMVPEQGDGSDGEGASSTPPPPPPPPRRGKKQYRASARTVDGNGRPHELAGDFAVTLRLKSKKRSATSSKIARFTGHAAFVGAGELAVPRSAMDVFPEWRDFISPSFELRLKLDQIDDGGEDEDGDDDPTKNSADDNNAMGDTNGGATKKKKKTKMPVVLVPGNARLLALGLESARQTNPRTAPREASFSNAAGGHAETKASSQGVDI